GFPVARGTNTPPDRFDQFPLEAAAAVGACVEAAACTGDPVWREEAQRAFDWFIGRNDLRQSLYDENTGGCRDALHVDRINLNQGAEATVAFALARHDLELLQTVPQQVSSDASAKATAELQLPDTVQVA